jgi:hypothetical protein
MTQILQLIETRQELYRLAAWQGACFSGLEEVLQSFLINNIEIQAGASGYIGGIW